MAGRRPSGLVAGVLASLAAAALAATPVGGQAGEGTQSAFRGRTDLIPVDVSVLDENRKPVRGLAADDFQVYEDGRLREIVAFSVVEIPSARAPTANRRAPDAADWVLDTPHDVVANDLPEEGRLVAILFDRSIRAGQPIAAAQAIARAAIDGLGPDDMAGVARSSGFVNDGRVQAFTADRDLLLQAVDSPFVGSTPSANVSYQAPSPVPGDDDAMTDCQCGLCVLETLGNVATALADAPRRRKVILFVGSALRINPPGLDAPCYAVATEARRRVLERIDLANVTVHVLDPVGLITTSLSAEYVVREGESAANRMQAQRRYGRTNQVRLDSLRVLPERTGGRLVANTNAPESFVPAIFEESQSYYLLGFEPQAPADGAVHLIDVRVDRRDVTVHTRRGYTSTSGLPTSDLDVAAGGSAVDDTSALASALVGALPRPQLPISVSIAAFPAPAGQPAAVAVELGASLAPGEGPRQVTVTVGAFDQAGRAVQVHEQKVEVPAPTDGSAEVREGLLTRLNLPPGRYDVRAAVRDDRSGAVGSVFTVADVPDFDEAPLSLSDVVFRTAAPPWMPDNPLADLLPFVPTVARTFTPREEILGYLRVRQPGTPVVTSMHALVIDARGQTRFEHTEELAPNAFAGGDAEYGVDLPLSSLPPGSYLLRFTAAAGNRPGVTQQVRFEVAER